MAADLLSVAGLQGGYGRRQVIFDAALEVRPGEVVAVVGHNGAGKTTLLKTIFGLLPARGGRVLFDGVDVCGESCRRHVARGMSFIPAEHFVFAPLTVRGNLLLGARGEIGRETIDQRMARVHTLFPALEGRAADRASTLSGGQQRMLSMGMAMMRSPRLLLLDEPSLGLAPALVTRLFEAVRALAEEEGQAVLLVEQNLPQAFAISDRVCVMRSGCTEREMPVSELEGRDHYWDLF